MLDDIEIRDMFHGRFTEGHVGRVLGADASDTGTNGWDFDLPDPEPTAVKGKARPRDGTHALASESAAVCVFHTSADKTRRPGDFSNPVAPFSGVRDLRTKEPPPAPEKSMTRKHVDAELGRPVAAFNLLTA